MSSPIVNVGTTRHPALPLNRGIVVVRRLVRHPRLLSGSGSAFRDTKMGQVSHTESERVLRLKYLAQQVFAGSTREDFQPAHAKRIDDFAQQAHFFG